MWESSNIKVHLTGEVVVTMPGRASPTWEGVAYSEDRPAAERLDARLRGATRLVAAGLRA